MEFFALIALGLGLIFTAIGLKSTLKNFTSGQWIPIEATVLSAGVDEVQRGDSNMPDFCIWQVYEYTYKGKTYRSPKYYLSQPRYFGAADAKNFLRDQSTGTKRTIWISDKFPQESTPERHAWIGWAIGGVLGAALMLFALNQLSNSK